jgi:tetratricopeptide (TPR) repeat protein
MAEAVDSMLEEAIEALRQSEKARAKDILSRLIQADQGNATYWIWMSAAVNTAKEQIYCLETALKLDPQNNTAKRGLVILGARSPEGKVKPFSLNRTRTWESQLHLAHERPPEGIWRNPAARLAAVILTGAALITAAYFLLLSPRTATFRPGPTATLGPSPTFTPTPTFIFAKTDSTPGQPTPLAVLLGVSYTPTPAYFNTPRPPESVDTFRAAQAAFAQGKWEEYFREMEQIQKYEPQAADIPYYIGEGYRSQGNCSEAESYYQQSAGLNRKFAPAYLGLARARLCIDPGGDALQLYTASIQADPDYGEVYLDRADFYLMRRDFKAALADLQKADKLMPGSALVQLGYAKAYLLQGNNSSALEAARKANSRDLTMLPSYYYLGRAYVLNQDYADAVRPLEIYLIYRPEDGAAYAMLGQALTEIGDYASAIEALNQALRFDTSQVQCYVYRGEAYLRTDNLAGAEVNFKRAIDYLPDSFEASIGLAEIYYRKGQYGNSYLRATTAKSQAENDTQTASALYWLALSQEGREAYGDAIKDWEALLAMPESAMTSQMRLDAQDHLRSITPPTSTPKGLKPSSTPTASTTPRPGNTATLPPGYKSPTPSSTATPTPTATP